MTSTETLYRSRGARGELIQTRDADPLWRASLPLDYSMDRPPVALVINSSPDVVDMLRVALERAGIVVVSTFTHLVRDGEVDLERFVEQHEPGVVVYDIAPPYDANFQLFEHLRRMPVRAGRQFVVTSTNSRHVEKLFASSTPVYEVMGKPYDIDQIVSAAREAMRAKPTR
jgi:CheY-like chemotaxis protein